MTLNLKPSVWLSDTEYPGSTVKSQKQKRIYLNADLRFFLECNPGLFLILKPGLFGDIRKTPGLSTESHIEPRAEIQAFWYPSASVSTMLMAQHYINTAGGVTTPTLVRVSDFMWMEGNPEIKDKPHTVVYANVAWFPWKNTTFSFSGQYYHERNTDYVDYLPAPPELGGVIEKRLNAPAYNQYTFKASIQQKLAGGRVSLSLGGSYMRTNTESAIFKSLDDWSGYGTASVRVGNCNFGASYTTPYKRLVSSGFGKVSTPGGVMGASFSYGNGNFLFSARITDILNTHRKSREIFVTPTYQSETERLDLGRRVTLTATYAFSFGRKVNASVEIQQVPGARESGILGISR